MVEHLRGGQPPLRRGDLQGCRSRRRGVGAGLSAAARPEDAADAAAGSADRLLPAHPVPARGTVHADAVADRDHRGSARCRPDRFPPARWCAELPLPGPAPRRTGHQQGQRRRAVPLRCGAGRLPHGPRGCLPHLHRFRRTRREGALQGDPRTRRRDPGGTRQSEDRPARCRPPRLHQGHRRPVARAVRTARRETDRPARDGDGAAGDTEPRTRRQLCEDAGRDRAVGRQHQRQLQRRRAAGHPVPAPPGPPR